MPLWACASCQLIPLQPILPALLLSLLPLLLGLSTSEPDRSLWRALGNFLAYLLVFVFVLAVMPIVIPVITLALIAILLFRLRNPSTRRAALVGVIGWLVCALGGWLQILSRDRFYELDSYRLSGHPAQIYAGRSQPFGFTEEELIAALKGAGARRRENIEALLEARAYRLQPAERQRLGALLHEAGERALAEHYQQVDDRATESSQPRPRRRQRHAESPSR